MKFNTRISAENLKNYKNKKKKFNVEDEKYLDMDKAIEASYTEKCKKNNEEYVSIEDIDRLINGMYLTDSKRRLFIINFIAGLGKGFGQAIGFTILAALVLALLFSWVDLPFIGRYIAKLLNIVQQYRK